MGYNEGKFLRYDLLKAADDPAKVFGYCILYRMKLAIS